jgi:phosphate transport system substrate-binding protein
MTPQQLQLTIKPVHRSAVEILFEGLMKARLRMIGMLVAAVAAAVLPTLIQAETPVPAQVKIDPDLPDYKPVQAVTGTLKIIGSDTMKNQMSLLVEGFAKYYPGVNADVEGKGSATAPPALLDGTSQFAPMSRGMKAKEVNEFETKYGYLPLALPTSIDMLEVYVHKDNPLHGLTLQQVDAIFSKTRKGGYSRAINTWGDLGLSDEWTDKPIVLYGRNKISGTNKFFVEHALFNGKFRDDVKEQEDSESVVKHVADDKYAMGYSGMGYKTDAVRSVPLALDTKSEYIAPEPKNAYSGDYPLTRMLLVYVNHKPGMAWDPLRREFIRYWYSRQGQADVVQSGFLPLGNLSATRGMSSAELKAVGLAVVEQAAAQSREPEAQNVDAPPEQQADAPASTMPSYVPATQPTTPSYVPGTYRAKRRWGWFGRRN